MNDLREQLADLCDEHIQSDSPSCYVLADAIIAAGLVQQWQPIETLKLDDDCNEFLVFDGVGVWKAWLVDGEIRGFEVDGVELPHDLFPPTHWMPLPAAPGVQGGET